MLPLVSAARNTNEYESIDVECKPDITDDKMLLNLLIEGYVGSECDLNTDYLFPFGIKQIIASYYRFNFEAYIKQKQETKIQIEKCANYWRLTLNRNNINIIIFLISLVISITAIIIGCIAYYNESNHCKDNYYIIDPTSFTLIGGALCLSHALFIGLHRLIALLCLHEIIGNQINNPTETYLNDIKKRHKWLYLTDIISKWIMLIFYLVWSMIGFYIFHHQMSHHCMQSNIAKTLISWSVIIFILAGYYYVSHSLRMIFTVSPQNDNDADYTMVLKEKLKSNKKLFYFLVPFITLSIFLLIMSQSKDILCNENYSMLKPTHFIIIGVSLVMLHIVFIFLINNNHQHVDIADIVSWILCIFYFTWSILGFYIYHNQLSSDCVDIIFATLFIVWSSLLFIISFIYHIHFARTIVDTEYQLRIRILIQVISTYPLCFLSIAVMIVGIYGDEAVCIYTFGGDGHLDMVTFAITTGIVRSAYFVIALCILYANLFNMYDHDSFCGEFCIYFWMFLYAIFDLLWCFIGFLIWFTESDECKQDILGQMIIAWCGIMCIMGPSYSIALYKFLKKSHVLREANSWDIPYKDYLARYT